MDELTYGPRSRKNARALIDAAKDLGYATSVVRTSFAGYIAPRDVVERVAGVKDIEEGVTYPEPPKPVYEPPAPSGVPRGNASRKIWEDFAREVGVDPEGLEYIELKRAATEAARTGKEN
jgi:hypothetical protein